MLNNLLIDRSFRYIVNIVLIFCISCNISTFSENLDRKPNQYFLKLSLDNNLPNSYDIGSDIAYSALQGLAYLHNKDDYQESILLYSFALYGALFTIDLNHEITGHAFRLMELGANFRGIEYQLGLPCACGYQIYDKKTFHIQKYALIALGGIQAGYLLGQKISDNLMVTNQELDPITAFGYIFSQGDQFSYIGLSSSKDYEPGNDIKSYLQNMEYLYGAKSMNYSDIAMIGWIDLLDPVMLSSIYSAATGNYIEIPKIHLTKDLSIAPFAKMVLTPYGIIEKKIGTYIFLPQTPIKISFGFGCQSKTKYVYESKHDNWEKKENITAFKGLNANEAINNISSYSVDFSIFKLIQTDKYTIGLDGALWYQPELFVDDAFRAKADGGFMISINNKYKASDNVNFVQKATYKTKGFISGHPIDEGFSFVVGIETKL
jgi:hypothetical protein